jgi:MFS family permease
VVSNPYFQKHFGLTNADGTKNVKRTNEVSSIVVSVLQGGAFFGALGSAPISGAFPCSFLNYHLLTTAAAKIGRKWTLVGFTLIFSVGAILTTVAKEPHNGLELIYAGRVISGFGIGGISAVAPAFVSECSPKEVRGRITGLFQIMVRHNRLFFSVTSLTRSIDLRLPLVS